MWTTPASRSGSAACCAESYRRGAGTVEALLGPVSDLSEDRAAALRVRQQTAILPASWVQADNVRGRVQVSRVQWRRDSSSFYRPEPPTIVLDNDTRGTALHEYIHHLQTAMPGANRYYQSLHRRRTWGEAQAELPLYNDPNIFGRRDQYVDAYFGREYNWPEDSQFRREFWPDGDAVEVMTMAVEATFHPVGRIDLPRLIDDDPEMLHLTLGLLFRYNPY